jgi:type II secretion system protein E
MLYLLKRISNSISMHIDAQIKLIGKLLVDRELITPAQLEEFSQQLKKSTSSAEQDLEGLLINKGLISEEKLLTAYSKHLNIPYLELSEFKIDPQVVSLIPAKFANNNKLIAIKKEKDNLTIALRNPFNVHIIDELKILTKLNIIPVLSKSEDILNAIEVHYGVGAETVEKLVKDSQVNLLTSEVKEVGAAQDLEEMAKDASIIQFVNQLILEAYQKRATDIHIEPFENKLRIRYRIDGVLHEAKTPSGIKQLQLAIVSRLKVMANLNIAEKRRSQDGRCKIRLKGEEVDLRLSTFPTLFGEGLSIRLLSRSLILFGIDQLGFSESVFGGLKTLLKKPNGIILVTGPTGCGKTTTLYACLNYLNDTKVNIITLEDPVEYQLGGINQIQINPRADLTFANGLRSILRQDPDIIMVGEIRDLETAQIAVRSALTGHLIFSTLHTNDALSTITRLLDLGIEPYLITNTLKAVIAQRLVRLICNNCKQKYTPQTEFLEAIGICQQKSKATITFFRGTGCEGCNYTGYKGRTGIYELLVMEENLSSLIIAAASKEELQKQAKVNGMKTLREDGLDKVKNGLTTVEEVIRVTEQV